MQDVVEGRAVVPFDPENKAWVSPYYRHTRFERGDDFQRVRQINQAAHERRLIHSESEARAVALQIDRIIRGEYE